MRLQAELAAIDEPRRREVRRQNLDKVIDAELCLALALEAYGEVVKGGDLARAQRCVDELEIPVWSDRRRHGSSEYEDPVKQRGERRALRRDLGRKKKRLEELKRKGETGREVRDLERELRAWERLGEE